MPCATPCLCGSLISALLRSVCIETVGSLWVQRELNFALSNYCSAQFQFFMELTDSMEQSPSWEADQSRNSPHFMEPEGSLPHSQGPATRPDPDPVHARTSHYLKIHLNILRTGLLNCLNARSRGLTFRHRASCI